MSLISMNLAGVRGRNRWGSPFVHISSTNATPISVLFVPNIALRCLSHAPAEEPHMQRSSGPFYPHIMSVCEGSNHRVRTLLSNDFFIPSIPRHPCFEKSACTPICTRRRMGGL
jgi:hypothetical protein